jgi:hypothetical protein
MESAIFGHEIIFIYIYDIVAISYFTVLENRKTSKDTGKNRWLPTLRVGACLSCVQAFCGASKADIGLTHAFIMDPSPTDLSILNLPITELPMTESFKLRSKLMGFFTLQDVLSADQRSLHSLDDYSEHWYYEFVGFLRRRELLHLLG